MEIVLLYFDGCPNWQIADERLAVIAAERPDITVTRRPVESFEQAERAGRTLLTSGTHRAGPGSTPDLPGRTADAHARVPSQVVTA